MSQHAPLPATVAELQALVLEQQASLAKMVQEIAARDDEIERLKAQIDKLRRMYFGSKSEKLARQIDKLEAQLEDLTAGQGAAEARGQRDKASKDVLVQSRRDKHAAKRLMRKLLKKHGRTPRVLITDKLKSYAAANQDLGLNIEHRQHKGLNNRAQNSHQPTRVREKVMRRFKSARHRQRFTSVHDQVANLFMHCRYNTNAQEKRSARTQAFEAWEGVTGHSIQDRLAA
jgi:SMC interacting uncharacterized protein involved in chromosome segregation